MEGLGMGGPDMGGLIWYGACNGGPGIVRNVPNPAHIFTNLKLSFVSIDFYSEIMVQFRYLRQYTIFRQFLSYKKWFMT